MNTTLVEIAEDLADTSTQGLHTLYIPARAMVGSVTTGATANQIELTTNKNTLATLAFANTSAKVFACVQLTLPKAWDHGTLTYRVHWTLNSTSTNGVVFGLQAVATSDGDVLDVAYGTAVEVTDAGLGTTAYKKHVSATSSALTIAGTPASGDTIDVRFYRDSAHGSDTLAATVELIGLEIFYSTTTGTDE